jgi:uncharacterized protein YjbI with pentapeptide repeats
MNRKQLSRLATQNKRRRIVISARSSAPRLAGVGIQVALLAIAWMLVWLPIQPIALAQNYTKEILVGSNFAGQDLTASSFTKSNLREADLNHANLQGVSLFGANLEGANLEGANLSNTTLDTARFSGANLTNAILEGAFAFNAKFNGAIINGADFTDVELRKDAQMLLCKVAAGKNPVTGRETRETLNCP